MQHHMHDMNIHDKHFYACGGFAGATLEAHTMRAMNIAKLRKAKGLTQNDLADMTGIGQSTISRAEKGDDGATLGNFKAIAEALGVHLKDLFADDRSPVEQSLVNAFRDLPPDRQKGWEEALGIAEGLPKSSPKTR